MSGGDKAPVVLVVGVGRSGTSLAMQALQRLGAAVSEEMVPASASNRRGAMEDWYVNDEMMALHRAMASFTGPRPPDWRDRVATRQAEDWLAEYLDRAARTTAPAFAVKLPLAGLFVPIWFAATAHADVELRLVWATRRLHAIVASHQRTFERSFSDAQRHYAQRTMHILQDAPDDTLLLPYEGWREAPIEQISVLAAAAGLPLEDPREALCDLFDPADDRSPAEVAGAAAPPDVLLRSDEALAGRLGRLAEVVEQGDRDALLRGLRSLLEKGSATQCRADGSSPPKAELGGARTIAAEPTTKSAAGEMGVAAVLRGERDRLRKTVATLRAERASEPGEAVRLRGERDRLRGRADALEAKAECLGQAYEALAQERDLADVRLADLASRHATALAASEQRWRKAQADVVMLRERCKEIKASGEAALKAAQAVRPDKAWRRERAQAQAEIEALRVQLVEAKATLAEQKALNELMRKSMRWRMGDAVAEAMQRPGLGMLALPYRLARLWRTRPD